MSLQQDREELRQILKSKSVKTGKFTLASGKESDLYVDCRVTTLDSIWAACGEPPLDFVKLAEGVGVPAVRATEAAGFVDALEHALRTKGPHLIEAVVPSAYSGLKLRMLPRLLAALGSLPRPLARAIKRKVAP